MATAKTEDTKVKASAKSKVVAPVKTETKAKSAAMIKVTLIRSVIGRIEAHKATVKGLGLRRMHHTVTVQDTPEIRGMINAVNYLLKVEA